MPLTKGFALLPNDVVQALIYNEQLDPPDFDAPGWLLGSVHREALGRVPLISLEALCGWTTPPAGGGHIALLRHLGHSDLPPYFAMRLAGAPWVVELNATSRLHAIQPDSKLFCVVSEISLDGQLGVIPDLDALGEVLSTVEQPHTR